MVGTSESALSVAQRSSVFPIRARDEVERKRTEFGEERAVLGGYGIVARQNVLFNRNGAAGGHIRIVRMRRMVMPVTVVVRMGMSMFMIVGYVRDHVHGHGHGHEP